MKALYDVPAPAKLNLFLHVLGRREDGYHLLQSVFVPIDWADMLHFELRDDTRLARHDISQALPEDDLRLLAARALQAASGTRAGGRHHDRQASAMGCGDGRRKLDAATTLLALNCLWGLGLGRKQLMSIGAGIGADVPFFLGRGATWVEGIGERLTQIELDPMHFCVLKPAASLPTREIFESTLLGRDTKAATLADFLADSQGFGKNDLQVAAQSLSGEVAQASELLQRRFGNSRMTGSGSAVFARLGIEGEAVDGEFKLPAGWRSRICRSLSRHPLWEWVAD